MMGGLQYVDRNFGEILVSITACRYTIEPSNNRKTLMRRKL